MHVALVQSFKNKEFSDYFIRILVQRYKRISLWRPSRVKMWLKTTACIFDSLSKNITFFFSRNILRFRKFNVPKKQSVAKQNRRVVKILNTESKSSNRVPTSPPKKKKKIFLFGITGFIEISDICFWEQIIEDQI